MSFIFLLNNGVRQLCVIFYDFIFLKILKVGVCRLSGGNRILLRISWRGKLLPRFGGGLPDCYSVVCKGRLANQPFSVFARFWRVLVSLSLSFVE